MDEKKFCPLNPSEDTALPCISSKCAWWDEDSQSCAMMVLARAVKKARK